MKTMRRIYSIPYVMWLLLFVIAPVLMIIYQSFFDMNGCLPWRITKRILHQERI